MQSSSSTTNIPRGYGLTLLTAVILSTTAIFIRALTQGSGIPALVLAFWRDAFVMVVLLPVMALFFRPLLRLPRPHWLFILLYGFLLACFNATWTLSVAINGAALATMLAYSSAGFTALLGWWLLKERLDLGKGLAVLLCLSGCTLISGALGEGAWQFSPLGLLIGTLPGLCYALYSLMGRTASQRGISPWTSLVYIFGVATLVLLAVNLIPGGWLPGAAAEPAQIFWLARDWGNWALLFALAAGPTLAGFGLYNVCLSLLPASVVQLIVSSEPVFTAIIAALLLGEHMNALQVVGSALILLGVLVLRVWEGFRLKAAARQAVAPAD